MRNIVALCSASLALASPVVVQAATFSPDGTYVFTGPVEVKKNLPVWTLCNMTLTITVSGGVATSSASLSGTPPCTSVTFTGSPFATDGLGSPVVVLEMADVTTNVPSPPDFCYGTIYALWGGNGPPNPRTIEFQDSLSDTPDASPPGTNNNCKIKGIVTQTSPVTQLDIT